MKVDGSFIATILETASVVSLYFAWRGITEGNRRSSLHSTIRSYTLQRTGITMCTTHHSVELAVLLRYPCAFDFVFPFSLLLFLRHMFRLSSSAASASQYIVHVMGRRLLIETTWLPVQNRWCWVLYFCMDIHFFICAYESCYVVSPMTDNFNFRRI